MGLVRVPHSVDRSAGHSAGGRRRGGRKLRRSAAKQKRRVVQAATTVELYGTFSERGCAEGNRSAARCQQLVGFESIQTTGCWDVPARARSARPSALSSFDLSRHFACPLRHNPRCRLPPFKLEDVCQFVRQPFFSTSARFDRQQQMVAIRRTARPHDHARFSLCVG